MKPTDFIHSSHPLLSDRVRLAIMGTLAALSEEVDFNTLLQELNLSKGNLSTHMLKLEESGLVEVKKEFVGRKPRTSYRCSDVGRREVQNYLKQIEQMLKKAKGAKK